MKKPFYKKWWLWVIVAIVVIGAALSPNEEEKAEEVIAQVEEEQKDDEPVELTEQEEIQQAVETIVEDDLRDTAVSDLSVNENLGLDDGSYVVLAHLEWNVKNRAKTTRDMLEQYSDHLAAKLADYNVSEVTVFWEVPYHIKGITLLSLIMNVKGTAWWLMIVGISKN